MTESKALPAILGGEPVRKKKIYYGKQWVTQEDAAAIAETAVSDYVTCGPKVEEAERLLCELTGAEYAVLVCNCTAALHIAALAAGVGPGDEVITTPLTFMASANCALYCGARPVFADVDPETYLIDPKDVEAKITERTKAVVAVDYTGQAVMIDELREICDRHHLVFIEDAAHSIGTVYHGKKYDGAVGSLADMTCFSFHPVKTVTCGEGGAVLTNDKALYEKLLLLRSHGMEHDPERFLEARDEGSWFYEQQLLGFNYRLTDLQASLLISQLRKLGSFAARRKEIARRYDEAFADLPGIRLQREREDSDTVRHLYMLRIDPKVLTCTRREFFDAMDAEGIHCQIHYIPVYTFPYYRQLGYEGHLCPVAEEIYGGILSIPLYPRMTDEEVSEVITAVKKLAAYYAG